MVNALGTVDLPTKDLRGAFSWFRFRCPASCSDVSLKGLDGLVSNSGYGLRSSFRTSLWALHCPDYTANIMIAYYDDHESCRRARTLPSLRQNHPTNIPNLLV